MDNVITMAHGGGGRAYRALVEQVFLPRFAIAPMNDAAVRPGGGRLALTTDSFVVSPLFFPGGDIGSLAVSGTVNDLAVSGAVPKYLTVGMILEEGLPLGDLTRIADSMAAAAREAGVELVTGDTKVVEKGRCEGVYLNTAGVGVFPPEGYLPPQQPQPGDALITSGPLGSHGAAILAARHGMDFDPPLKSDARPMQAAVRAVLAAGVRPSAMRDPTRGGAAAVLNEWAGEALDLELEESMVPVLPGVRAACELWGIDPLTAACEGVILFSVPAGEADRALAALQGIPGCAPARLGTVSAGKGRVHVRTSLGTYRRLLPPSGVLLPRIC